MKKVLPLLQLAILVVLVLITIEGCATIVGQSKPELINIRSTPDQASIEITDETGTKIFEGKTPTNVSLKKKKGFFSGKKYTLKISKEGYADKLITIDTKVNGWYIGGNLLFGGLIGWLIVDPASGAMWTLDTEEVNVSLETAKQSSLQKEDGTKIVLLNDVPQNLRDKMVRIN